MSKKQVHVAIVGDSAHLKALGKRFKDHVPRSVPSDAIEVATYDIAQATLRVNRSKGKNGLEVPFWRVSGVPTDILIVAPPLEQKRLDLRNTGSALHALHTIANRVHDNKPITAARDPRPDGFVTNGATGWISVTYTSPRGGSEGMGEVLPGFIIGPLGRDVYRNAQPIKPESALSTAAELAVVAYRRLVEQGQHGRFNFVSEARETLKASRRRQADYRSASHWHPLE